MVCSFVAVANHFALGQIGLAVERVFCTNVRGVIKAGADGVKLHVVHFHGSFGRVVGKGGVSLVALFVAVVVNVAGAAPLARNIGAGAVCNQVGQLVADSGFPIQIFLVGGLCGQNVFFDVVVNIVVFEEGLFDIPLGARNFLLVGPCEEFLEFGLVGFLGEDFIDAAPFRYEYAKAGFHRLVGTGQVARSLMQVGVEMVSVGDVIVLYGGGYGIACHGRPHRGSDDYQVLRMFADSADDRVGVGFQVCPGFTHGFVVDFENDMRVLAVAFSHASEEGGGIVCGKAGLVVVEFVLWLCSLVDAVVVTAFAVPVNQDVNVILNSGLNHGVHLRFEIFGAGHVASVSPRRHDAHGRAD